MKKTILKPFGITISLVVASISMTISSITVVINSLRLKEYKEEKQYY